MLSVPHPKEGNIIWNCLKDNIIEEKDEYKAIEINGFDYKLFEEEDGGGFQEGLYRYPYFMHLIKLWSGVWVKQMSKTNQSVGDNNCIDTLMGRKRQVRNLTNN